MGLTLTFLSLIVLIPLSSLIVRAGTMTGERFWGTILDPRVVASFQLTFGASALAAAINVVFGFVLAWVLVRYRFPGRSIIDALVDLPFALPTAVSGTALTAIYAPTGWLASICIQGSSVGHRTARADA